MSNEANPYRPSSVNQNSQPEGNEEGIETNLDEVNVDANDVNAGSSPDDQPDNSNNDVSVLNRQKELERRLDEVKKLEKELKSMKNQGQEKPVTQEEFLTNLAKDCDILDQDGKPDVAVVGKLTRLMNAFYSNVIDPRLATYEQNIALQSYDDYDLYKDDIDDIIENDLSDIRCSQKRKIEIAYEMAKSRNPKQASSNVSVNKPNMSKSSVNIQANKPGISQSEVAWYTQYAKDNNLPVDRLLKTAKKLKAGNGKTSFSS